MKLEDSCAISFLRLIKRPAEIYPSDHSFILCQIVSSARSNLSLTIEKRPDMVPNQEYSFVEGKYISGFTILEGLESKKFDRILKMNIHNEAFPDSNSMNIRNACPEGDTRLLITVKLSGNFGK